MIPGALYRWLAGAALVAGLCLAIYVLHLQKKDLAAQRDNAVAHAAAYKAGLQAYRDQYAAQTRAINTEKGREIARQENLLRTLNLIGDIDENQNSAVSDAALSAIDSMYGIDPAARGNKPAP